MQRRPDLVRPDAPLLEVGCAKGYFVAAAQAAGYQALGVDVSRYAIEHCVPGLESGLMVADAVDLPFGDALFGTVCAWELLEHVDEETLPVVLDEIERVLLPGGSVWLRIGTVDSDAERAAHEQDTTHVTTRPTDWWRRGLALRGWLIDTKAEDDLRTVFAGRDWAKRTFVYQPE